MISAVLYGRNDNHGYNLQKRAALSLNAIAAVLDQAADEILFVDYNTPDDLPTFPEAIADVLTAQARALLRVIRVRPAYHRKHFAAKTHLHALEPIARNIAIRRMTVGNRWVLSTNTDMILVPRGAWHKRTLSAACATLVDGFYHAPRMELPEALWETLNRLDPQACIDQAREWGRRFQLDELSYSGSEAIYDGPGDFQLMLRSDIIAMDGFHEEMLLGWHVDSNISRRAALLRGKIDSLHDRVFGYHCDHTREATIYHQQGKPQNNWGEFVSKVARPYIPEQRESWGAPLEIFEEIRLGRTLQSTFALALENVVEPFVNREYHVFSYSTQNVNDLRYSTDHILPYLMSMLATMNPRMTVAYVGGRRKTFDMCAAACRNLQLKPTFTMSPVIAKLLGLDASSPGILVEAETAVIARADVFVVDFSLRSFADDFGPASDVYLNTSTRTQDDQDALHHVSSAFVRMTAAEPGLRADKLPRKFITINTIINEYAPLVNSRLNVVMTPASTRVRHGYAYARKEPVVRIETIAGDISVAQFPSYIPLNLTDSHAIAQRSGLSRIAGIDDFLNQRWFRWAEASVVKAMDEPASWSKAQWLTAHYFYTLAACNILVDDKDVLVMCDSIPSDMLRYLWAWVRRVGIVKWDALKTGATRFACVTLAQNTLCLGGVENLGRKLQQADSLLELDGICYMEIELSLFGAPSGRHVDLDLLQSGFFRESVEQHTGWRLQGPLELDLSARTLERLAPPESRERPHFVTVDHGARINIPLVLVYKKVEETTAVGWSGLHNDLQQKLDLPRRPDYGALVTAIAARRQAADLDTASVNAEFRAIAHAAFLAAGPRSAPPLSMRLDGDLTVDIEIMRPESKEIYIHGAAPQSQLAWLKKYVRQGMHVLEIGCGSGVITALLAACAGCRGLVTVLQSAPEEDVQAARRNVARNGFTNVRFVGAPGHEGVAYDLVYVDFQHYDGLIGGFEGVVMNARPMIALRWPQTMSPEREADILRFKNFLRTAQYELAVIDGLQLFAIPLSPKRTLASTIMVDEVNARFVRPAGVILHD